MLNPSPQPADKYDFFLWHAARTLSFDHVLTFNAPGAEVNFFATAWYRLVDSSQHPPGSPGLAILAFSVDSDEVITDTPIASATPDTDSRRRTTSAERAKRGVAGSGPARGVAADG